MDEVYHARKRNVKPTSSAVKAIMTRNSEPKENSLTGTSSLFGGTAYNTTSATVNVLNAVAEGSDVSTRIGRKINHKSLSIDMYVSTGSITSTAATVTGATQADWGFWAIVLDRQPNGNLPNFTDIFDSSGGNPAGQLFNTTIQNQDRFLIIRRETVDVVFLSKVHHTKKYIDLSKLKGLDQRATFGGTGSGIGNMNHGSLYLVCAQSNPNNTGSAFTTSFIWNTKYRFTDY